MNNHPAAGNWALRAHVACDWVMWAMTINALWIVFTLAGGIVLGVAPASVAAADLTRRRLRGEADRVISRFAERWWFGFWRSNLVVGPPLLISALLGVHLTAAVTTDHGWPAWISATAMSLALLITAIITPLFVHYELPLWAYVPTTSRWMVLNPAPALLLVVAAVAVAGVSAMFPGLIPFVSIGAWLTLSTALCLGFFTANDRLVAERSRATILEPSP